MTQLTTVKGITYFHIVHLKWLQRVGAKEIKETNHSKIEIKLYYLSTTTEMLEKNLHYPSWKKSAGKKKDILMKNSS